MVMIILLYLMCNAYAGISGFKDAILYSAKGVDAFTWNEHIVFVLERASIMLIIIFCMLIRYHTDSWEHTFADISITISAWILSFSFWHNGFYYVGRHNIDTPKYNFFYSSKTSSARLEFGWWGRLICKIISVVLLFIYIKYIYA